MFTAALFTKITKRWKQPKCPSTDEKRRCGMYTGILLSHKKNGLLLFTTVQMDLRILC